MNQCKASASPEAQEVCVCGGACQLKHLRGASPVWVWGGSEPPCVPVATYQPSRVVVGGAAPLPHPSSAEG